VLVTLVAGLLAKRTAKAPPNQPLSQPKRVPPASATAVPGSAQPSCNGLSNSLAR
jgi:hypothetical protein